MHKIQCLNLLRFCVCKKLTSQKLFSISLVKQHKLTLTLKRINAVICSMFHVSLCSYISLPLVLLAVSFGLESSPHALGGRQWCGILRTASIKHRLLCSQWKLCFIRALPFSRIYMTFYRFCLVLVWRL